MKLGLSRTTTYDLPLVAVVLVLLTIGLAMVYSASGITALDANDDPSTFLAQQSAWAALGVAAMFVVSRVDYRLLRYLAIPMLVLAVILLGAVLIPGVGVSAGGATRWLRFGIVGLQPAELAKLALIVYLATWLGAKRADVGSWRVTIPFVLVTMLVAGLVIAEPDLGTTIVIVMVALGMYFAAGARVMMFAALGMCTAVGVAALAVVNPERLERLTTFMNPWAHRSRCSTRWAWADPSARDSGRARRSSATSRIRTPIPSSPCSATSWVSPERSSSSSCSSSSRSAGCASRSAPTTRPVRCSRPG